MLVSIVCPFYNEEKILDAAIRIMLSNLEHFDESWELILVNDGSTDGSPAIARRFETDNPGLRLVSYERNQGRGHALVTGIRAAKGDIIITTEIDCSWGDDIVQRLTDAMRNNPGADMVVASPNLPGGGYRSVPLKRVFLSTMGNLFIRTFFTYSITMNTGMTRAYRPHVFDIIETIEKGKEFHLEVLLKAMTFKMKIVEIPCILEWRDAQLAEPGSGPKKSSTKIGRTIKTHISFSIMANPVRYFFVLSALLFLSSIGLFSYGIYLLAQGRIPYSMLTVPLMILLLSIVFFGFGVTAAQNRLIERDLWRMQAKLLQIQKQIEKNEPSD